MPTRILTILDHFKNITFSGLGPDERVTLIRQKQMSATPIEILGEYGLIEIEDKPIRVILKNGQLYYCLRDVLGGAGVTRGYHKDMRERIQQAAIEGPGAKNPAYYLPAEFLPIVVERARYNSSKRFVQLVMSNIKAPSDTSVDVLVAIQHLDVGKRQLAFAGWVDMLRQAGLS